MNVAFHNQHLERITTRKRVGFYRCNACGNFDFTEVIAKAEGRA